MENNYYKLEEKEIDKIKEIESITYTDYEIENDMIKTYALVNIIEDLLCAYHELEEEKEDLEKKMQEDYNPKIENFYEEYGISERDFL